MRFSLCIEMFYPRLDFSKRLAFIAEAGFGAIEFWSPYDKDLAALGDQAKQLGLEVANFSAHRQHSPVLQEDLDGFLEEVTRNARAAERLGCEQLMVLSDALQADGSAKPASSSAVQQRKNLLIALRRAARIAEGAGILLCLEPLNLQDHPGYFLHRSEQAFELIKEVDSPHLKVLYDIYHMQRQEGHILETIERHIQSIGYFHVADVPGRFEPGSGELNYPNILGAIDRLGFVGTIGFECRPQAGEPDAFGRIRTLIRPFQA
ncbi:MAG TPA: TIM barrel protein [Candidatus Bipolaricaulota bacterium]